MRESDVVGFTNKAALPVVKSPCPADGKTRRKYVEELLRRIDRETPGAKNRIFTAIENGWLDNWK